MYVPRVIKNLTMVNTTTSPPFAGKRAKGSRAKGYAFERRAMRVLSKRIPDIVQGQWFKYEDVNGHGFAQPDMYVVRDDAVFLFELKTKENDRAWLQLYNLYKPILEFYFKKPVYVLQIVGQAVSKFSEHLSPEALMKAPKLGYYVWILTE